MSLFKLLVGTFACASFVANAFTSYEQVEQLYRAIDEAQ